MVHYLSVESVNLIVEFVVSEAVRNALSTLQMLDGAGSLACLLDSTDIVAAQTQRFAEVFGTRAQSCTFQELTGCADYVLERSNRDYAVQANQEGVIFTGIQGVFRARLQIFPFGAQRLVTLAPLDDERWTNPGDAERYRALYDNLEVGIYRSTFDGQPNSANPAFVRMMGYASEREWLEAARCIESEWYADPGRRRVFIRLMEMHGRVTNFVSQIYRHRTGEKFWVIETARAVKDAKGQVVYFEGTIEDITPRVEMEEAAQHTARQAQMVAHSVSAIVEQMRASLSSPNQHASDPRSAAEAAESIVSAAEEIAQRGDTLRDAARQLQNLEETKSQLKWFVGELINAKKRAEDAATYTSRFLASMSHELRTPLNAILGYSEILQEDLEMDGNIGGLADAGRIRAAARHLLHLINDLLDLSKMDSGQMTIVPVAFSVPIWLEDVAQNVKQLADRNGSFLEVLVADAIGSAFTDQVKLTQCLLNLISNACRFTERGKVTLRAERLHEADGDYLRFQVEDTGCGITPERMETLFEPVLASEQSLAERAGGTGLGLTTTRRLAELLGGNVSAVSKLGEGSVFTLTVKAEIEPPPVESGADGDYADSGMPDVLIIDDEASARDLTARALSYLPVAVRSAGTAAAGLAAARARRPACIVLDIVLPDGSGWDVLTALRKDPAYASLPILVYTVVDDPVRAQACGATRYLMKPADRASLIEAIKDLLTDSGHRLEAQEFALRREECTAICANERQF